MKLLVGYLAGWVSAQTYPQYNDYGYYAQPAYDGKSQVSQNPGDTPEVAGSPRVLGNGRICWSCLEETYTECLTETFASGFRGDTKRHGPIYCSGEDYFCYISERRTIRHSENDYNFETGAPWSAGTTPQEYQNQLNGEAGDSEGYMRVQMGCQQPLSCLRQQWQNYQIRMGQTWHGNVAALDAAYVAAGSQLEVRPGLCRHHRAWKDYANGIPTTMGSDEWRRFSWMEEDSQSGNGKQSAEGWGDRRFGSVEHYQNRGKGTESVCHYCCDAYTEYNVKGCNNIAATTFQTAFTTIDVDGAVQANNIFMLRPGNIDSADWGLGSQYHGAFRNPHTQTKKTVLT